MDGEMRPKVEESMAEAASPQARRDEHSAQALASMLSDALDHFRTGVVLLATEGRIIHSNSRGRRLLARAAGVTCEAGRLCIDRTSTAAALAELIDRAFRVQHRWHRSCVGLVALTAGESTHPLHVCVTSMPGAGGARTAGLFVTTAEAEGDVSEALLRQIFGLTPTESRVTQLLVRGQSVAEAAGELRITIHTLRSHLKRIFEKTGARRQSELVRVVATGLNILDLEF